MLKKRLNPLFYEFEISVRAANGLTAAGITTIKALMKKEKEGLHRLMMTKGLGRKTFNELKDLVKYLKSQDIKNKMELKHRRDFERLVQGQ
jgi:DNA-directed RNA polymerase alpha subunit